MFANDPAIRENIPLAPLTTLRVGGPARYFLHARNCDEVETGVRWARERDLPILVLGGGSNLVVADEGYPGLVLRVGVRGVESHVRDGVAEIVASAGEPWTPLVSFAVNHGWAGIECLAGIPGFVGATPVQNVGAYGQEVRETIAWVEAFDTETFETVIFHNEACQFEYRDSRFKQTDYGRYLILRVCYHLLVGGPPTIRYGELERFFATENILTPTIADVHMAVLDIRRRKSMIHDHSDPNTRSAGSFFVNPIMTIEEYSAFE
ncbi:MAG TPA: UDP-N-acetylmuramate dehydrogenase, partial [Armatimonadota bacterium]|nr:UDP-N-acetylmuramate dehydrogenase [Armatimonadota bacterium]